MVLEYIPIQCVILKVWICVSYLPVIVWWSSDHEVPIDAGKYGLSWSIKLNVKIVDKILRGTKLIWPFPSQPISLILTFDKTLIKYCLDYNATVQVSFNVIPNSAKGLQYFQMSIWRLISATNGFSFDETSVRCILQMLFDLNRTNSTKPDVGLNAICL